MIDVCLFGAGLIGSVHARNLARNPRARFRYIVDPRPEAASIDGNISLAIGLNDPESAKLFFENLAQGGRTVMPLQQTYWAEAFGMVTDKFGVKWMVNCEARK